VLSERQHAWNDVLKADDEENLLTPRHRVVLLPDYTLNTPSEAEHDDIPYDIPGTSSDPSVAGELILVAQIKTASAGE